MARVVSASVADTTACNLPKVNPDGLLADGRPGVKLFAYGADAMRRGDYTHAIYMFKVAASLAYAPAEYNLGLLYFRGQGVPADRPLGAAWMTLAAAHGNKYYAHARDLLVTALTDAQFQEMQQQWQKLRQKYNHQAGMRRAEAQWAWARANENVGSRVGSMANETSMATFTYHGNGVAMDEIPGSGARGSMTIHQMYATNNPYQFAANGQVAECPNSTVRVEPLQQVSTIESGSDKVAAAKDRP